MLKFLQTSFLLLPAVAVAAFSTWRYFRHSAWWLVAVTGLIIYVALLSGLFLGGNEAWNRQAVHFVYTLFLSSEWRAILSLLFLAGVTGWLCVLAYRARPAGAHCFEVRVYDHADVPGKFQTGAIVVVHTRTDGLTRRETVGTDGAAVFRSLPVPTTMTYQIGVVGTRPPFEFWGSGRITELPDRLALDAAAIPAGTRQPFSLALEIAPMTTMWTRPPIIRTVNPRPADYLANVDQRGDHSLQPSNAPWGVPPADVIVNRLSYSLGYDLERRLPRWVACAIGPTGQRVPQTQTFEPDPAIASDRQAHANDYSGSGYDRGHLIPPADLFFKGPVSVAEAFYMSTVTPQTPWLNRQAWSAVEHRVRETVKARGQPAYVVAGPLFVAPSGDPKFRFTTIASGRIPVPTHFFRVVAMATADGGIEASGVIVPNADEGAAEPERFLVSIGEIEQKSGLRLFPFLPPHLEAPLKGVVGRLG